METAAFSPSIVKVLVAALSSFVLGGLWYGPLFARPWQRLAGLTDERLKAGNPAKIFGLSYLVAFVQAWVFAMFLGPRPSLALGLGAGFSAGLCWVGGALAINDAGLHSLRSDLLALALSFAAGLHRSHRSASARHPRGRAKTSSPRANERRPT